MRASRTLLLALGLLTLVACSKGDDGAAPTTPSTGGLDVSVLGLPEGVAADVEISGPSGYSQSITASQVLDGLAPGSYTITSRDVSDDEWDYTPSTPQQSVMVGEGAPRPAEVNYVGALTRGSLAVAVSGLPSGASPSIQVTGPDSFAESVSESDTLRSLEPGSYTVTAALVMHESTEYVPFPEEDVVNVVAGSTSGSFVSYGERAGGSVDFFVDSFEITQATQTEGNDVPLIRDRDAYLRIWGLADDINAASPDIRVDFFVNDVLQQSETAQRAAVSTPTSKDRGSLAASWNLVVPAGLIQPNLSLRFEIDPENDVAESLESNNRYPGGGGSVAVDVTSMQPLPVRLVPVLQSVNGLQGDATAGNADDYVSFAAKLYPFPSVDVDVRSVYTTSVDELQANGTNWSELLQELLAVRNVSDQSDRYYFGVVQTTYTSGVAGLGYVPNSRSQGYNVAMGWDRSNSRGRVAAHEMGHNLGRSHSPCGNPANPDPDYPYAGASIGTYGVDVSTESLKAPQDYTDIMGYCNPQWISDYTYENVLTFSGGVLRASTAPTSCVLIWGRVEDGELVLEPAFQVQARPHVPARRGDYRVSARDADGHELFSVSFDPPALADHPTQSEGPFAFTIPVDPAAASQLEQIEVTGRGQRAVQMRRSSDGAQRRMPYFLTRVAPNRTRVEWDASVHPVVMVRDATSGEVLSFARGGAAEIHTDATQLELWLSDGASTEVRAVAVE